LRLVCGLLLVFLLECEKITTSGMPGDLGLFGRLLG
jgi:hypothetical protein